MTDFPKVKAMQYHKAMDSGKTRPYLMTCEDAHGQQREFVVKLRGSIGMGIVREAWCAALANILELPAPAAALVDIDPRLGRIAPDFGEVLAKATGPHFGSRYIPNQNAIFTGAYGIPNGQESVAAAIFAFDYLVQNPDRRKANSNILLAEGELRIIDHEMALAADDVIGGRKMPWQLAHKDTLWTNHVLYGNLRTCLNLKSKEGLILEGIDAFLTRLRGVTSTTVARIAASLPELWNYTECNTLIHQYVADVLDDLSNFERGLREVLA